MSKQLALATLAWSLIAAPALAQKSATAEFEKFRNVMEEDNPAELFEARGEEYWKKPGGPKKVSLEKCDLGLGPGVVKGAYVQMPRYFADADQVMDAERRVVHCMVTLQGIKLEDITKQPFSNDKGTPMHVSVVTYVAAQSRKSTRRNARPIRSARRSSASAPAPTISRAAPATGPTANASGCRICPI
jgi:sulfur-oxidizing protein SoxA